jgi:hypothetical protein
MALASLAHQEMEGQVSDQALDVVAFLLTLGQTPLKLALLQLA